MVGVADDPPAATHLLNPPGPPDARDPLDAQVDAALAPSNIDQWGRQLAIDQSGTQTMMWDQDLLTPTGDLTELYALVISDRASDGGWVTSPVIVESWLSDTHLAVNASGAAAVVWADYGVRRPNVSIAYRDGAGAGWTPPQRVPDKEPGLAQIGIDDAGRVLVVYVSDIGGHSRLKAVRRGLDARWEKPREIGPPHAYRIKTVVGARGSALVAFNDNPHEDYGPYGGRDDEQFTARMSPAGVWSAPFRQPDGLSAGPHALAIDGKDRALLAWWHGTDLVVRWSRTDERWRRPCVVADDVSGPRRSRLDTQVAVNRRGDALVVWRATNRVAQLWARYKPAGQEWTQPVRVTPAGGPPRAAFGAAIGEDGHAAVAWTTHNNQQLKVRRLTPWPRR